MRCDRYLGINESCRQWKIERVAHAVTTSSDKPIILEAKARARVVEVCLVVVVVTAGVL